MFSFANLMLLGGAGLVAVPILLHLLMRQQPKRVVFPAVRFIRERQLSNRRRLRFRHLLLLAARCAVILLLVLALARPSIPPEAADRFVASSIVGGLAIAALIALAAAWMLQGRRSVLIATAILAAVLTSTGAAMTLSWLTERDETSAAGGGIAPVAAALVFDTSPRMSYRQNNVSRLDAAREMGLWIVGELPGESEIAVLNARSDSSAFAVDRGAAQKKIEALKPTSNSLPMASVIAEAFERVRESALEQREVYVFTDLTSPAWPEEASRRLTGQLAEAADVQLYLIDVGAEKPVNFTLGDIGRFDEASAAGSEVTFRVDVAATGAVGTRTVELHEYISDPKAPSTRPDARKTRIRGRQTVTVGEGEASRAELSVSGFAPGATQGYLQLVGEDGLAWDDRRYYTVTVAPPLSVLVAAPKPVDQYAEFLAEAIRPSGLPAGRYECERIELERLAEMKLDELQAYAAICVVDPTPGAPKLWTTLADYARLGGGVGVFLGRNAGGNVRAPIEQFNTAAAALLPAPLVRIQTRTAPAFQFIIDRTSDSIVSRLKDYVIPWSAYPVYKYWQIGELPRGVRGVARFDSGHPAIIDQPLGQGRVIWMTTPVSDPASLASTWNLLPTADPPWPFLALVDGIMAHLTGSGADRFNYTVGDTAVLAVPETVENAVVTTPLGDNLTIRADLKQRRLFFGGTEHPGSYRARAGGTSDRWERGFSVNSPAAESDLSRVDAEALRQTLGRPELQIVTTRDQLTRDISRGRVGIKLFPFVMMALAALMGVEFLLATLFYRSAAAAAGKASIPSSSPAVDMPS